MKCVVLLSYFCFVWLLLQLSVPHELLFASSVMRYHSNIIQPIHVTAADIGGVYASVYVLLLFINIFGQQSRDHQFYRCLFFELILQSHQISRPVRIDLFYCAHYLHFKTKKTFKNSLSCLEFFFLRKNSSFLFRFFFLVNFCEVKNRKLNNFNIYRK